MNGRSYPIHTDFRLFLSLDNHKGNKFSDEINPKEVKVFPNSEKTLNCKKTIFISWENIIQFILKKESLWTPDAYVKYEIVE